MTKPRTARPSPTTSNKERSLSDAFLELDEDELEKIGDLLKIYLSSDDDDDDDADLEDRVDALEDESRRKSGPPPIVQAVQSLVSQSPAISSMLVDSFVETVEKIDGVKLTNLERRLNLAKTFGVTLKPKQIVALLFPELDLTERANGGVVHASSRTTIRTEVDDDGTVVSRRETSTDHFVPPEMPPMPEESTPTRSSVKHS